MEQPFLFTRGVRLLVVGDVMLDGYANGGVDRISPEAPVPVLRHLTHLEVPGGAANVAMSIAALGGCPRLVSVIGGDDEGRRLAALLMGAIAHVDMVVIFEENTPFELIQLLRPDLLVKSGDYAEDEIVDADIVKAAGGRVARVDFRAGHSTTRMVERSRAPELVSA